MKKSKGNISVMLDRCPEWKCENIFCCYREAICTNQSNCMSCVERRNFLNYVLSDKNPSMTLWGRKIQDVLKLRKP